ANIRSMIEQKPQAQDPHAQPAEASDREAICGQRVGDRRVRVSRPSRGMGHKVTALLRRILASRN
ncbi:MAG: hypothetical protein WEA81_00705, partial [Dehalococcoidia bacterium]